MCQWRWEVWTRLRAHLWTCIGGRVSHIRNTWLLLLRRAGAGQGLEEIYRQQQNCFTLKKLSSETLIQDVKYVHMGMTISLSGEGWFLLSNSVPEEALIGWDGWEVRLWGLTAWFQYSPKLTGTAESQLKYMAILSLPHILPNMIMAFMSGLW